MGVVHSLLWAMQGLYPRGYPNSKVFRSQNPYSEWALGLSNPTIWALGL